MKPKEAISSSTSNTCSKAETVGEELYLVHLRRHEGEEPRPEDFDFENLPKKRSSSVGEELWNVHMKRSKGIDPDPDCETPEQGIAPDVKPSKEGAEPCRYNLRTIRREVKSS